MGCGVSRGGIASVGVDKKSSRHSGQSFNGNAKSEGIPETETQIAAKFVAGYTLDPCPGGTLIVYEDYRGFETTSTNHISKAKTDKVCIWADDALEARRRYNNGVFFNPQNPSSWPKEAILLHTSSPSFADRHSIAQNAFFD